MKSLKNLWPCGVFIFIIFYFSSSNAEYLQNQSSLTGDWQGKLKIPGLALRIVFHITVKPDGAISATMDSPDQGATGIPVSQAEIHDTQLRLLVRAIGGLYEGNWDPKSGEIKGTWQQGGKSFPLIVHKVDQSTKEKRFVEKPPTVSKSDQNKIVGIWQGQLAISGFELRIVFHIDVDENDLLKATMDSPDQGAKDIPTSRVVFQKDSLKIEVAGVAGRYDGVWQAEKKQITGVWRQGGRSLPLILKRVDKVKVRPRPQEPIKPYPYRELEVEYENKPAGIRLAGTLTFPQSGEPFPAAILISGSGPQDRDETVFGHKPFWVLADYLTRLGVAVLRVDDRGTGRSTGDFSLATSEDFATDVLAGVEYLKSRKEIDPRKIGLIGHSEGGLIAPLVAAQSTDIAFIVLLAGPGLPGDQVLLLQKRLILQAQGASAEMIEFDRAFTEKIFAIVKTEKDNAMAEKKIRELKDTMWQGISEELKQELKQFGDQEQNWQQGLKALTSPWVRFFLNYDPAPTLKKVTCPVLALNGEKDLQVAAAENLRAIEAALKAGGNRRYEVKPLPGLNHLFQTAQTGTLSEYAQIEETFSPTALKIIGNWIRTQTALTKVN